VLDLQACIPLAKELTACPHSPLLLLLAWLPAVQLVRDNCCPPCCKRQQHRRQTHPRQPEDVRRTQLQELLGPCLPLMLPAGS
jgi:hypothetical protein